MPNTLIPIQTYTLGSSATSVTFDNIPQNYTDLKIVISGRDDRASQPNGDVALQVIFNGTVNTGSIYTQRRVYGSPGTSAGADSTSTTSLSVGMLTSSTATANTFGNTEIYIPNYTSSNSKPVSCDGVSENNGTVAFQVFNGGLISTSNPITGIKLFSNLGTNLLTNSTFTLYGISNGVKATGGTITVAGGYAIHTFTSTGSFLPTQQINGADFLVIAGGGSGGQNNIGAGSGGGGAGGYRTSAGTSGANSGAENKLNLIAGNSYTVIVGAGGAALSVGSNRNGNDGTASVFSTISSTGGGGGAGISSVNASVGNSGGSGGGGNASQVSSTGGAGTFGQGFAGGIGGVASGSDYAGGGGGGAGAVGSGRVGSIGGAGGAGLSSSINGTATTRAGGGGGATYGTPGGAGGAGGGGTGGASTGDVAGTAGTANTGGGGGGTYGGANSSGAGGSGIVIIRYPLS
jgi:hypothetical protein